MARQVEIQSIKNIGGGVPAYRDFLIRTEGEANMMKFTLSTREKYFDELEKNAIKSNYKPDRETFLTAMYSRKFNPALDKKFYWIIATAKLNQSERFGIGLGEAYGKDQDKFDKEPERLYVMLQEHYHTRILGDVVRMFDLPLPMIPPSFWMRQMVKMFVAMPHERTLAIVAASEMVGCRLFGAMRDMGVELFKDEPEVSAQINNLYNEIFADEIGHVGFLASKLGKNGRAFARMLSKTIAFKTITGSVPELKAIFTKEQLANMMADDFDVYKMAEQFPERSWAAAQINQ